MIQLGKRVVSDQKHQVSFHIETSITTRFNHFILFYTFKLLRARIKSHVEVILNLVRWQRGVWSLFEIEKMLSIVIPICIKKNCKRTTEMCVI